LISYGQDIKPHVSSIEAGRGVRGNRFGELTLSSLQSGTEEHCPCLPRDPAYRFVVHDEDTIFSKQLDMEVTGLGVRVLRTPVRSPRANAVCERLGRACAANASTT
jgi:hypothetical protein